MKQAALSLTTDWQSYFIRRLKSQYWRLILTIVERVDFGDTGDDNSG